MSGDAEFEPTAAQQRAVEETQRVQDAYNAPDYRVKVLDKIIADLQALIQAMAIGGDLGTDFDAVTTAKRILEESRQAIERQRREQRY
jgi:hypothetical protein